MFDIIELTLTSRSEEVQSNHTLGSYQHLVVNGETRDRKIRIKDNLKQL